MNKDQLKGIQGWLILPALNIILSIPMLLYSVVSGYLELVPTGILTIFGSPESPDYINGFFSAVVFEAVGNIIVIIAYCYLAYLFFTKNYKAPKWFISIMIGYFIFTVVDLIIASSFFGLEIVDNESKSEVVRALITCFIWVPYFLRSKRVKNTFVEGKPTPFSVNSEDGLPKVIS